MNPVFHKLAPLPAAISLRGEWFSTALGATIALIVFTNCAKPPASDEGGNSEVQKLDINTLQGLKKDQWKIDTKNNAYINSRNISVTGTCTAINRITAFVNGAPIGESIPCDSNNSFKFNYTALMDGNYLFHFQKFSVDQQSASDTPAPLSETRPASSSVTISAAGATEQNVVVDTVPPSLPVITTNGGSDMLIFDNTFSIIGTTDLDTINVLQVDSTRPASLNFNLNSSGLGAFQMDGTAEWGTSVLYSFVAVDLAGNQSAPARIRVGYNGSVLIFTLSSSVATSSSVTSSNGMNLVQTNVTPVNSLEVSTSASGMQLATSFLSHYTGFGL